MNKFALSFIFLMMFGLSVQAEELGTVKSSVKRLAPFTFNQVASWSRDSDLYKQKTSSVCLELLDHLNHPRSNELFKSDGTLAHESEQIKSMIWETLEKEQYREGFMTVVNGQHPNIQVQYLQWYVDPEWTLQRTLAHPYESYSKQTSPARWLYRLLRAMPNLDNRTDPASNAESLTFFPTDSEEWLGDIQGRLNSNEVKTLLGGARQWIAYSGQTFALENASYALPKYIGIDAYKLILNSEGQSFLVQVCALHARIKK
jgi:hypothetical protein